MASLKSKSRYKPLHLESAVYYDTQHNVYGFKLFFYIFDYPIGLASSLHTAFAFILARPQRCKRCHKWLRFSEAKVRQKVDTKTGKTLNEPYHKKCLVKVDLEKRAHIKKLQADAKKLAKELAKKEGKKRAD